uniref:Lymphatic vessel endothelial hyaluronic receptor 1a n=1 Tax=Cyprinus carpio TaxID=7962 RepID=A0A8C2DWW0_CYPCA
MARVWMRMLKMMMLFSGLFMSSLTFDIHLVKGRSLVAISGVIISSIGNQYALNASAARDLCEHLGLTIASKAQVAEAQKHSLETCRFGWIDEQIAVIPRVQAKSNCGSGKTGVVVWHANPSTKFEVFYISLGAILLRRPGSSWGFVGLLKGLTSVLVLIQMFVKSVTSMLTICF